MTETIASRWEAYSEAGRRCFGDKQFDRAEEAFLAALRSAEHFGDDDPRLAQSLNNLARVYGRREKFFPAAALLHRLLGIQERALGENHPGLAGVLTNLAEMYARLGDARQELALRQRALELRLVSSAADDPALAPMRLRIDALRQKLAEEQAGSARPAVAARFALTSGPYPSPGAPLTPAEPRVATASPAASATAVAATPASARGLESALIWPEPKLPDVASAPAPSPAAAVPRIVPSPAPVVTPTAPSAPSSPVAARPAPKPAPLAPPLPTPLMSRVVVADASEPALAEEIELDVVIASPWRTRAVGGVAAVALVALLAFVGRGLFSGGSGAEATEQAAGMVGGEVTGVSEEEMLEMGLAAIRASADESAPAAPAAIVAASVGAGRETAPRVERARTDAEPRAEQPPPREARAESTVGVPLPRVALGDVTRSIEAGARARVDSMTRASQLKEPSFRKPTRLP